MSNYSSSLRDPRWQRKRLEVLQKHSFKCDECYDEKSELNVHHGWYEKNKKPWDYPDECFKVFCESCHKTRHEEEYEFRKLYTQLSNFDIKMLSSLINDNNFCNLIFALAVNKAKIIGIEKPFIGKEWVAVYEK